MFNLSQSCYLALFNGFWNERQVGISMECSYKFTWNLFLRCFSVLNRLIGKFVCNHKTCFSFSLFFVKEENFLKSIFRPSVFYKISNFSRKSLSKKSCTCSVFSVDSKNYLPVNILFVVFKIIEKRANTDLSMNILCAGNKSVMQRDLFKNSAGYLLPTLRFLGGLYNLHHFLILFSLM